MPGRLLFKVRGTRLTSKARISSAEALSVASEYPIPERSVRAY